MLLLIQLVVICNTTTGVAYSSLTGAIESEVFTQKALYGLATGDLWSLTCIGLNF